MDKFYNETRIIDIKEPIGASYFKNKFVKSKMDIIKHWNKSDWINWSQAIRKQLKKHFTKINLIKDKML